MKEYRNKKAFPQVIKRKNATNTAAPKEIIPIEPEEASLRDINWLRSNTGNWIIYETNWKKLAKVRRADYLRIEWPELIKKWSMLSNVKFSPELVS